jgi:uncharacterized protein YoxC
MELNTAAIIGGLGVLIFFFRDAIFGLLGRSIRKANDEADKKDQTLAQKEDALNDEANKLIDEAKKLTNDINNQPEDEDWHKKR